MSDDQTPDVEEKEVPEEEVVAPETPDAPEAPAVPVAAAPALQGAAPVAEAPEGAAAAEVPDLQNIEPSNAEEPPAAPEAASAVEEKAAPAPLPPTPGQMAAERNNADMQYQQDLAAGHIQPKTYQQLFAKKDTLGKIGTFFGLLLSGAGSGLTGQSNAVMDMMNKEIDRDLEAQKQSKENAQNFLRIHYGHDLQQAQAKSMEFENALKQAQVGAIPTELKLKEAQASAIPSESRLRSAQANALDAQNAGMSALNGAKNKMLSTVYQDLMNSTDKMPPGPTQDNARATLQNVIGPAVGKEIQNNNMKTEAQIRLNTQANAGKEQPGVDLKKMQKLIIQGELGVPGAMSSGDSSQASAEAAKVESNRAIAKAYDDSFKKLDKAFAAGKLNKQLRAAEVASLGAAISRATTGQFSPAEALAQANGMFPEATDFGGARKEKYVKTMEHFRNQEAATPVLDRFGLKNPFPSYSYSDKKTQIASDSIPVERRNPDGTIGLFDPKTKKFLGLKGDASSVASRGK